MPYKHNNSRRHTQRTQANSLNPSIKSLMLVPIMKLYAFDATLLSGFVLFKFHRWRANLRIFEVEEIKSVPYVPTSHPFIGD